MGKKPPVFTVADLPGYGHAVASDEDKKIWKTMIRDYLGSRQVLSRYVTVQYILIEPSLVWYSRLLYEVCYTMIRLCQSVAFYKI